MPRISQRGSSIPESPIRKLVPHTAAARKRGIEVLQLNIGQPDLETPEIALQAVKNNTIKVLSYSESEGFESYRKKLTKYYHSHNIDVDYTDIMITTGASEALMFTIGSIADPGDEVIVPEPFYANYTGFLAETSANVIPLNSSLEDGFSLPPSKEIEKLIRPKTKAILICNPGNPTGHLYTKEEINSLKELAIKYDLFLVADEVYREFIYDDLTFHSIMSDNVLEENSIIIDSVSKRYSMCGARIGCIVSKNKAFMETVLKYAQARLSPPTYAQIACEAVLDLPPSYYQEVLEIYTRRRNVLITELKKIPGIKSTNPKGAFYCLVALPIDDADHFALWLLNSFSNNNQTVMVAPASGFYVTPNQGKNQIRIAYVLEEKKLIRAIEILKLALSTYIDLKH